jgi:hypothetical protein
MPTAREWLGQSQSVTDVWTGAISGTVTSQTFTLTINGKNVAYTSGGSDTVAIVAAGIVAAWNALSPLPPPEFQELIAAGIGAIGAFTGFTVTQKVAGRPTVITAATSGAATFTITNTTVATGPSFFDNAANWNPSGAPANGDTLTFDVGSTPCCYNITTALTTVTVNVLEGYTGSIGLPAINGSGSQTYAEYRGIYLTLAGGTLLCNCSTLTRGNFSFGAHNTFVRLLNCAQRPDPNVPTILIIGGNSSSTLDVSKSDFGLNFYAGTTSSFTTVNTGYLTNPANDVKGVVGVGATLVTVNKNGGVLNLKSGATTVTADVGGGTLTVSEAAAITTLSVYAGQFNYRSTGTIGTMNLYGKTIMDCSGDTRAKTITNPINVFASQVQIIDNAKTINGGTLSINGEGVTFLNVQHGGIQTAVYT